MALPGLKPFMPTSKRGTVNVGSGRCAGPRGHDYGRRGFDGNDGPGGRGSRALGGQGK